MGTFLLDNLGSNIVIINYRLILSVFEESLEHL